MPTPATHWVPARFTCLTDEQIGDIQHRIIDLGEKAKDLAAEFGVSSATVYRAKNAVPKDAVEIDQRLLKKLRAAAARQSKPKKRKWRKVG